MEATETPTRVTFTVPTTLVIPVEAVIPAKAGTGVDMKPAMVETVAAVMGVEATEAVVVANSRVRKS